MNNVNCGSRTLWYIMYFEQMPSKWNCIDLFLYSTSSNVLLYQKWLKSGSNGWKCLLLLFLSLCFCFSCYQYLTFGLFLFSRIETCVIPSIFLLQGWLPTWCIWRITTTQTFPTTTVYTQQTSHNPHTFYSQHKH